MMRAFHKMHGLGNDFAIFDAREAPLAMTESLAHALAERHNGIGCDHGEFMCSHGRSRHGPAIRDRTHACRDAGSAVCARERRGSGRTYDVRAARWARDRSVRETQAGDIQFLIGRKPG